MSNLRAKFKVQQVTRNIDSTGNPSQENVELWPVYASDPESPNHQWSKATPAGKISLTISNPEAWGILGLGKEFYIDFTRAE